MLKSFSECEKLLLQLLLLLPLLLLLLLSRLAAVFALCQAFKIVPTVVAATGAGAGMESSCGEFAGRPLWRMRNMQLRLQLSQINSLCCAFIEQIASKC